MLFSRLLGSARAARFPTLPSLCAVCHGWGHARVCHDCLTRFAAPAPRCQGCALRVPPGVAACGACLREAPAFDATIAAVDYGFPWHTLLAQFKFREGLDLAEALTTRLEAAVASAERPDLLLPVPLSPKRLRSRGYNQAWELARRLGRRLEIAADPALLLRVRDTPHQLSLPPAARVANVRGAFVVEPLRRHEVAGRSVAVIDDVMTTGATAAEIARVLKQAGATRVSAWVVARTPAPGTA